MKPKIINILIAIICVGNLSFYAQEKAEKLSENFNVEDNVEIIIDTQRTEIVIETWNKNSVAVDAFVTAKNLSEEELQKIANNWNLNVVGNSKSINISSSGLATPTPPIPPQPPIAPIMENIPGFIEPLMNDMINPLLEGMAEMPLPPQFYEGMSSLKFDYEAYQRDGEKYVEKYEKEVEEKFGEDFETSMEAWGKRFEERAEAFEERAKAMQERKQAHRERTEGMKEREQAHRERTEAMQERAKALEKRTKVLEKREQTRRERTKANEAHWEEFDKKMEEWGEQFGQRMEKWATQFENEAEGNYTKTVNKTPNGTSVKIQYSNSSENKKETASKKTTRTLHIKIPKKARLHFNVRHGNVTLSDAVSNLQGNLSHTAFSADAILGEKNTLDLAYSPLKIDYWEHGNLTTSYVKECDIKNAKSIRINSNASNVVIGTIEETGIITGSFGELSIAELGKNFKQLDISLENSDLLLQLPSTAFNFSYSGAKSKIKYPEKLTTNVLDNYDSRLINGYYKSRDTESNININASFSDVTLK